MKVGDLVKYNQSENILVVVSVKRECENNGSNKAMIRCFCPRLQDHYWFWEDSLEVVSEGR